MEAALDAQHGEPGLPEPLGDKLRAGVRILREAAEPDVSDTERKDMLRTALTQLQTPPMVFLPHDVTRAAEAARVLTDRALRQS